MTRQTLNRRGESVELENIRYVHYDDPDRRRVQDDAIQAAKENPARLLNAYRNDSRSFAGHYVAADLFKEMFAEYAASKEARNLYNNPVHNTAAVLSSALFSSNLAEARGTGRNAVYFLTGSPGAGKTSLVLGTGALPHDAHMVFEGQMSSYETSHDKISRVLTARFEPRIIAVHVRPEVALDRTLRRFQEEGRGSSINAIANIQGGLPESLSRLGAYFGNRLQIDIIDLRDADNPVHFRGAEHIQILKSEGTREHILERLEAHLDGHRREGRLTDDAWRQAAGHAPRPRLALDSGRDGHRADHDTGRSRPAEGRQATVLGQRTAAQEAAPPPASPTPLKVTDASRLSPEARAAGIRGTVHHVDDQHVLVRTGEAEAVRFPRNQLPAAIRDSQPGKPVHLRFQSAERVQAQEPVRQVEQKRDINRN